VTAIGLGGIGAGIGSLSGPTWAKAGASAANMIEPANMTAILEIIVVAPVADRDLKDAQRVTSTLLSVLMPPISLVPRRERRGPLAGSISPIKEQAQPFLVEGDLGFSDFFRIQIRPG
jgi:hypothetical protein